jgi:hypothetical protein
MNVSRGLFRAWLVVSALLTVEAVRSQSLDEPAMCSEQAKKAFKEYSDLDKFASEAMGMTRVKIDYKNHYNTKIKKCLIYISRIRASPSKRELSIFLFDANEKREYAAWVSDGCVLPPRYPSKKNCTSREEFDALVEEYLTE